MKRLVRLSKGDTENIRKALASMHKALEELEKVLSPRFTTEVSMLPEKVVEEELTESLVEALMEMMIMAILLDYMVQFFPLARSSGDVILPSSTQIDWVEAQKVLTPQELSILECRIGAEGEHRTLREIGQDYSLTRERIRQIQKAATKKLEVAGLLTKESV